MAFAGDVSMVSPIPVVRPLYVCLAVLLWCLCCVFMVSVLVSPYISRSFLHMLQSLPRVVCVKKDQTYFVAIVPVLTNELLDPPRVSVMSEEQPVTMVMATNMCFHGISMMFLLVFPCVRCAGSEGADSGAESSESSGSGSPQPSSEMELCSEGEIVEGEGCGVRGVVREKLLQVRGVM